VTFLCLVSVNISPIARPRPPSMLSNDPSVFLSNVSRLGQTLTFLPTKVVMFHLDAPKFSGWNPERARVRREKSEAESNPKRNFRPPKGENLRRIS
jgi:hypothetical protein